MTGLGRGRGMTPATTAIAYEFGARVATDIVESRLPDHYLARHGDDVEFQTPATVTSAGGDR